MFAMSPHTCVHTPPSGAFTLPAEPLVVPNVLYRSSSSCVMVPLKLTGPENVSRTAKSTGCAHVHGVPRIVSVLMRGTAPVVLLLSLPICAVRLLRQRSLTLPPPE